MHWIALQPASDALDAPVLTDATSAWAWWALQFTPLVARLEDALLLEVSASQRLFGGVDALLAKILKPNWAAALVECTQGATSLIAFARLQCQQSGALSGHHAACDLAADALPLATLAAARPHLPTLARLGLSTWGQLRALPRGGLVRRFGAELVDALDRAYGQRPEVYPWLTLPDVFDAPLELLASVESAPALLFGARRLLAQLQVWLRARQRGVLALELVWELDARRGSGSQGRLELRTAQPTQDMAHLARLLAEQLARVTLPAPVLHLRMRSLQTQALAGESISLLPEDVRHGDSLHQLLERLGARLGAEQVRSVRLQADHRPEHMQRWGVVSVATKSGANHVDFTRARDQIDHQELAQGALYPTWLLAAPQRLGVQQGQPQYQGPLTLLAGPQRLEAGWLEGRAALRDYYVARSPGAGLVWVYCDRLGAARWYLHGLFA
ncbi:MAG: DNA polymerase Y family protein [Rhodoferax sp.]